MNLMDVAAAAGVSLSTVSRVINGGKNISPGTVSQIHRVMRELGYLPDTFKSTQVIRDETIRFEYHVTALSFGWKTRPNFICGIEFLNQLTTSLASQGIEMTYLHWPWRYQLPSELVERSHGFIIVEGTSPAKLYPQLASKPVISLFCPPGVPGDQILTGYYQVGQLAASYLMKKNIRHLVLLRPRHQPGFIIEQGEGFKLFCMKEENIVFDELYPNPKNASSSREGLEHQVKDLLDQLLLIKTRPIGIFAPSCHVTALAYRYLQQLGIVPGKEIHFVCSNSQMSLLWGLHPRPAVIDIGLAEMAENAANLLRLRIKNPEAHRPFQVAVVPCLMDHE
jgi:DNA-binding LacI/PurR family transcriptional regulator